MAGWVWLGLAALEVNENYKKNQLSATGIGKLKENSHMRKSNQKPPENKKKQKKNKRNKNVRNLQHLAGLSLVSS